MTIQTPDIPAERTAADQEALFREARRLRRRRWIRGLLIAVALAGICALVVLATSRGNPAPTRSGGQATAVLPRGPVVSLKLAGPLAVAPNGTLYVADVASDRVLLRSVDGRFRVIAGNGHPGFSGDGGPAVHAELSQISDLAVGPNGSLYVADGGRIRVISPAGVIRTVAGNGTAPPTIARKRVGNVPELVRAGTAALSASLGSTRSLTGTGAALSIAFSPTGQLYISTGTQILRLTAAGKLDPVPITIQTGPFKGRHIYTDFGPIAIDSHGDVDVAGINGWSIWQITANGVARELGYARQSGGDYSVLQRGPGAAIYGELGDSIVRVGPRGLVRTLTVNAQSNGQSFVMTNFAFTQTGTIYADDISGNAGFEAHQQLLSDHDHHISLLWQQKSTTSK
jgi:hypothetical protein